jgi:hypothetical protein
MDHGKRNSKKSSKPRSEGGPKTSDVQTVFPVSSVKPGEWLAKSLTGKKQNSVSSNCKRICKCDVKRRKRQR